MAVPLPLTKFVGEYMGFSDQEQIMRQKIRCMSNVSVDSMLEEIHDEWSDKDILDLIRNLWDSIEAPDEASKRLGKIIGLKGK